MLSDSQNSIPILSFIEERTPNEIEKEWSFKVDFFNQLKTPNQKKYWTSETIGRYYSSKHE